MWSIPHAGRNPYSCSLYINLGDTDRSIILPAYILRMYYIQYRTDYCLSRTSDERYLGRNRSATSPFSLSKRTFRDLSILFFSRAILLSLNTVRQAKKRLHRTQDPDDPTKHRAHVCIVCYCFLTSIEPLRTMTRAQLKSHRHRLGVNEYERYHQVQLKQILIAQYHIPTCWRQRNRE